MEADPSISAEACLRTAGERLMYLRRRAGLNLIDVAKGSGLSKSELSRLENGERRLKAHHLQALGPLYGIDTTALEEFVSHDPVSGEGELRLLPCFSAPDLVGKGMRRAQPRIVKLPFALELGPDAYMIAVHDATQLPVPGRSVVVIDPAARAVLGDLAANIGSWSPVLVILRRDEAGNLIGTNPDQPIHEFQKAVAVFSMSHFEIEQ